MILKKKSQVSASMCYMGQKSHQYINFTTCGPRQSPGFWGSFVFHHAPIQRKGSDHSQIIQCWIFGSTQSTHNYVLFCP